MADTEKRDAALKLMAFPWLREGAFLTGLSGTPSEFDRFPQKRRALYIGAWLAVSAIGIVAAALTGGLLGAFGIIGSVALLAVGGYAFSESAKRKYDRPLNKTAPEKSRIQRLRQIEVDNEVTDSIEASPPSRWSELANGRRIPPARSR